MLSELCKELNNWFDYARFFGKELTIEEGALVGFDDRLREGQWFRIVGSVFNDGVYQYPTSDLTDEVFDGAVWAMAVPPAVVALAEEIEAWQTKYGGVDSAAMSPFLSESFGGYSYSKGFSSAAGDSQLGTWQSAFGSKMNRWRKIHPW